MKTLGRSIKSFILAVLVLCSTFSFAVEKHYCDGEVVDYSLFGKIDQCCGEDISATSELAKTCCATIHQFVKASNDQLQFPTNDLPNINFFSVPVYNYFNLVELPIKKLITLSSYLPPKLTRDFRVVFETFLI